MNKIYTKPEVTIVNLYTAEEIAQGDIYGDFVGYSRKVGESPGDDEQDFAKQNNFLFGEDDENGFGFDSPWED